jgi:hypothetical protein
LTIRRAFSRTSVAVAFCLLFASLVGVAHVHPGGSGWSSAPTPCPTCLFKLHTPSASGKPPVVAQHLGVQRISLSPALPPRSFSPAYRSQGRAPPPSSLSPNS